MLDSIVSIKQQDLLTVERRWLADLQLLLARAGVPEADRSNLARSIQQLEELFLLVVVGEFNSGKSAFINALLGQPLLEEGVTPTTREIHILRFGGPGQPAGEADFRTLHAPIEILRHIHIVDTPGTNAVMREHQAVTEEFIPRSDLVLFVTSADRPFTESERAFLSGIREWGKKVVLAVNKVDILETPADVSQVLEFVRRNAAELLGARPDVFPVSARLALRSKTGRENQWAASGFEQLERYIRDSLDEATRMRLKFLNPLGVADRVIRSCSEQTDRRFGLLGEDIAAMENLDRQLALHRQDMERDLGFRLADLRDILHAMEQRANAYFDETMRLGNILDLIRRRRIQQGFEARVVADTAAQVEAKVTALIDWLVASELKQWQQVMGYLEKRRQACSNGMVGSVDSTFRYDRDRLIESVGRTARQVVGGYDTTAEARNLAEKALLAVAGTASGVGAGLGLGAAVTAMATSAAADVTGILAAGVLAAVGLLVIPARRRAVKRAMNERVQSLCTELSGALQEQVGKELQNSLQRIQEAIAPYTRFVRAERQRLEETKAAITEAQRHQSRLRRDIEELFGPAAHA
jgi:small GTP-binding protein